ncbi:hypothetical protein [Paraurantiacibacter namhicola]|uniref:Uncharacterized protein n=1 Tax=Paraurantiacibacter namhicola TaxID=645517 RepID=A0A1C7D9F1_9SPHN|nr:hypothetical protein [Paraurantiacibacter namhicola]ANU08078.1 hypothetical protein A6F65_01783 [Paraurantiacibacter namhicola]
MGKLLVIIGATVAVFGGFFMLQGLGIIMWPAESFMLANETWVTNGAIIMVAGLLVVILGRRIGRR